jgi:flagellar capping protein FliD
VIVRFAYREKTTLDSPRDRSNQTNAANRASLHIPAQSSYNLQLAVTQAHGRGRSSRVSFDVAQLVRFGVVPT